MRKGRHALLFRRDCQLTGVDNALKPWPIGPALAFAGRGSFACYRAAHAIANLRRVEIEFSEGPAERIAMHAEFFCSLALVAFMVSEHLEDVALLELLDGVRVGDSGAVHLDNDSVEFALQGHLTCKSIPTFNLWNFIVASLWLLDPAGRIVLELLRPAGDLLLEVVRYNEGYPMRTRKEIGCEQRISRPAGLW